MSMAPAHPRDPVGWCAALALAFWALLQLRLTIPSAPYFDEVHYLPAARALLEGSGILNQEHPPLGKLIFAGGIALFGDGPLGWRLLPSIAGGFALYAGMRALWYAAQDRFATIAFGILAASGFALFIHARIAMLDIFMAAFVATACWQFAAAIREPEQGRWRLALTGVALGLAMASKWNALVLAPLPGLVFLIGRMTAGRRRLLLSRRGAPVPGITLAEAALWLGLVPLTVYALTYVPLYITGDDTLVGGLIEQHRHMLILQSSVKEAHTYQSVWWQWVTNTRGIWYLYELTDGAQRGVLLIGNPVTMLLGLPALVWCAWRGLADREAAHGAVALLYAFSLGLWLFADKPVQFYYHYFVPSLFLLAALALALGDLWRAGWRWFAILPLVVSVAIFVHFWPIVSAAALNGEGAFAKWMWLDGWI